MKPTCAVEDCARIVLARQRCDRHYREWHRDNPDLVNRQPRRRRPRPYAGPERCEAPNCVNDAIKFRPYCAKHAARMNRHGNLLGRYPTDLTTEEKFRRLLPEGLDLASCWEWPGTLSTEGYGLVGAAAYAHRTSYEIHHGPIPDGLLIRHTCDNRRCVNPAHLLVGTHADNSRDMVERNRCNPRRHFSPAERQWVIDALAGGMSARQAAMAIGMSPQNARSLVRQAS